ncbi:MAG: poly(3-hydroxybutyrate) depolymerase [Candidatus Thermoplasmatota archaeon]|nr:poly(3-hydroxybutyrate) depolymerase [Candidatus Thermoplasmatota archaeon]MBS3801878.1 poly(3-hydroxybutyrate) depolymerase [Candidatus Thermoplasmatota archaeon]
MRFFITKNKITFLLVFITIILLSSFFLGCVQKRDVFTHDELQRTYILHLPVSYSTDKSYPLVLVFHGGGGNAENTERLTNFSQKADEENFIVVYPEGTGKLKRRLLTWNCGFCCGYALENNIDDIGFIRSLIEHLQQKYTINSSMIYATGLSNGGIMSYYLGAELSDIFAAIAPVAAQIGGQATAQEDLWQIPEPEYPVSVISFNGMNDSRVPYNGGTSNETHVYSWMSTNESISFWVQQNQCNEIAQRNISKSGNIISDTYSGGKNNAEVTLVTIVNGTHSWPGGQKGWENGAEPTKEINATDMIWDFFKNHPKTM